MRNKINDEVIETARETMKDLSARIKRAEVVYADLSGNNRNGGLTVSFYGDYVIVDDGQDRWLAHTDQMQEGLNVVLNEVIDKDMHTDDLDSSAYDSLCTECPALYSRIGHGEYNNKTGELLELLSESLDDDNVADIVDYLGIKIEAPAE